MALVADEIADRVNCHGVGTWLGGLSARIGTGQIPSIAPGQRTALTASGIMLRLVRIDRQQPGCSPSPLDAIAIDRAEFDAAAATLPFALDAARETPVSALGKLSTDTVGGDTASVAAGDRRISYFLPDALVVELAFRPAMVGIERIVIARLGAPQMYVGPP